MKTRRETIYGADWQIFDVFRIFACGGYSRAEYLKKKGYFKSIGEHCYLQPWNFGTEPYT